MKEKANPNETVEVLKLEGCTVILHRPILSQEEREKRMRYISYAAENLLKEMLEKRCENA